MGGYKESHCYRLRLHTQFCKQLNDPLYYVNYSS